MGGARIQPALAAIALLNGFTFGSLLAVLAPYMYSSGFSGSEFGLLTSTSIASSVAASLASGRLSDAVGARRVLTAGFAGKAAAFLLIASGSPLLMAIGFLLQGLSMGASWSAGSALVARSGRDETLHYTFSYFAAASTLGSALGGFAGAVPVAASRALGVELIDAYRLYLAGLSAVAIVQAALSLRVEERFRAGHGSLLSDLKSLSKSPGFSTIMKFNVIIGLGASMSIHNIGYYFAAKYGGTSAEIGFVSGLEALIMSAVTAMAPRLASALGGPLRAYVILASSSVPLLIAMTLVGDFALAALIYVVRTVLMNAANPLLEAVALRMVPLERRGTAAALISLTFTVPAAAGRSLGGFMLDIDLELPLRLTAALYMVALAYLYTKRRVIEESKLSKPRIMEVKAAA